MIKSILIATGWILFVIAWACLGFTVLSMDAEWEAYALGYSQPEPLPMFVPGLMIVSGILGLVLLLVTGEIERVLASMAGEDA
ncbi:MAG TPA: hypothetical protein VN455_10650 [Methanotrichaceae archaeon]|nr:hypothetical protein [Methanotrichaceae archaeon]